MRLLILAMFLLALQSKAQYMKIYPNGGCVMMVDAANTIKSCDKEFRFQTDEANSTVTIYTGTRKFSNYTYTQIKKQDGTNLATSFTDLMLKLGEIQASTSMGSSGTATAGVSIESKQDVGNVSLANIDASNLLIAKESGGNLALIAAKDFATQATLLAMKNQVDALKVVTDNIKAKTDNIDVALSTRTKPSDTQLVDTGLTGLATASNQVTGNNTLGSIDTKLTNNATSALQTAGNSTLTTISGKDFATEMTLALLNGKVTTTANGVKVDGSAVVQPISATALPLPSGASTSANQATEITALNLIHTDLANNATTTLQTVGNSSLVTIAGKDFATETTLSTLNGKFIAGTTVGNVGLITGVNTIGNVNQTQVTAGFSKFTDGTNDVTIKAASTASTATDKALVIDIRPTTASFGANTPTVTAITTTGNTITTTNCIKILIENQSTTTNATVTYGGQVFTIGYKGNSAGYSNYYAFDAPYDIASRKYSPFATMVVDANLSNIFLTKIFAQ